MSQRDKPERAVDRRGFLSSLGKGMVGVVAVAALPKSLRRIVSGSASAELPGELQPTPGRLRRWAMVIDLRRCDGCQSIDAPPQCTQACIEGHLAPEPMEWIQVYEQKLHGGGTQFVPTPCMQCQNPPCVNMCPVGATFSSPEGVVLIDQDRCIGCRICMEACVFERRFFNWGDPPQPPEAKAMAYDPEMQSPAVKGTVMKCNFCPQLARAGRLPYCAQACPHHAIYYGDLEEDVATNGVEVATLSQLLSSNTAYRMKEELGTMPRVYYIPGHGQLVGRVPSRTGRKPSVWPWRDRARGDLWTR